MERSGVSKPRRILYVSGTRADFGLMKSTLQLVQTDQRFALDLVVTGMHLDAAYGMTVNEIEQAGLNVVARIPVTDGTPSGALMGSNVGRMTTGLVSAFEAASPDLVLLLGDRGEMLAGAIAALHLNIPIAHIHGGERSGTVDEPVRHAISKLSHLHLVATEQSHERLIRMGEPEHTVHVVGAPGLDGLAELPRRSKAQLAIDHGLRTDQPIALLVFHPILQESMAAGTHIAAIIDSLLSSNMQVVALKPNSDSGSAAVRAVLERRADAGDITLYTHLTRPVFVEFMSRADVMIGNSSSGIIEAATFGTPVINIGSRQNLRQRNGNITDVGVDGDAIKRAITAVISAPRPQPGNVYGDGRAGPRIIEALAAMDLVGLSGGKTNAY